MRSDIVRYREVFPENLDIRHKIAPSTEKTTFHLHNHLEIIYTVSDNLICRTEDDEIPLPANALLLLNSMSLHYIDYRRDSGLCDRYVLYFDPNLVLDMNTPEINLLDCFMRKQTQVVLLKPEEKYLPPLTGILERMAETCRSVSGKEPETSVIDRTMDQLSLKLDLGQLLILINRIARAEYGGPESPSYQAHSQLMTEICQYIDNNYSESLSVDMIAREFLLSKTQLYNISKEVLRMSVSDYISHVRLTQAKSMLINTEYSVEIISQKAGYSNLSAFSRVFKTKVGLGPLQYRKQRAGATA